MDYLMRCYMLQKVIDKLRQNVTDSVEADVNKVRINAVSKGLVERIEYLISEAKLIQRKESKLSSMKRKAVIDELNIYISKGFIKA